MALGGPAQVSQKAALGQRQGCSHGGMAWDSQVTSRWYRLLMGDLVPLHRGLCTGTETSTCLTGDVSQSRSLRTRALASLLLMTEPRRHGAPVPPDPVGQASREDAPGEGGDPGEEGGRRSRSQETAGGEGGAGSPGRYFPANISGPHVAGPLLWAGGLEMSRYNVGF